MKKLKLWFEDMWGYENYQFNPSRNYFHDLLSLYFDIELDEINPDLLIFSCFGLKHRNFQCRKLFFTGENTKPLGSPNIIYPDYNECDASLSFFSTNENNLYFPLWVIFINWFQQENPISLPSSPTYTIEPDSLLNRDGQIGISIFKHKKPCVFINNNPIQDRCKLFHNLSNYIQVDSYGKLFNNVGFLLRGSEQDKHSTIRNYRSTIAYENSTRHGYNTEKVVQPYSEYCIAIYSGGLDKEIFSTESLIYRQDYGSDEQFLQDIIECSLNFDKWHNKIMKPLFKDNQFPPYLQPLYVLNWICNKLSL